MATLRRRRRGGERGAAAVEFALVSVVFFTLVFGIIQFGLWFWSWQAAGHAAREAARVAAVSPCQDAAITDAATNGLQAVPSVAAPVVTFARTSPVAVGDEITVTVAFDTFDIGFLPLGPFTVNKSATSRVENVPGGLAGC